MKNFRNLLFLVFAVLAFLVSCGGSESKEPGSIYGVVTDKATGESIINAGVELQPVGLKTVTGSDGQFEFNEVAVGTYTLYVTKTGYSDNSSSITVNSGKQSKGDVQLEKAPAALRIVDDDGKDISEIDFGAEAGDISRQFNIFNDGTETLEWEISFSAEWIKSFSKESGELKAGGTQGVIMKIDRELLESVENITTIHITSNDGNKQLTVKATNSNPCKEGYWDGSKCDEFPPCDTKNITPCRDRDTNYIWSARARQDMDWDSAMAYCDNLSEGGYDDWNLPSIDVLKSLYADNGDGDHWPTSKLGDQGCFWSSTSSEEHNAQSTGFGEATCWSTGYDGSSKSDVYSVRCVIW